MYRITLSKVASYLFRQRPIEVDSYIEIVNVIQSNGLHPKTPINHEFSTETQNIINLTITKLEAKEKALQKLKK